MTSMIGNSTTAVLSSVVTIFKRRSPDFNADEHGVCFSNVVLKIRRTIEAKRRRRRKRRRELISILIE
jgi:hypothetical protein